MSLTAWRIVKAKHAVAAFSGQGARQFGGRWNSPGVPMVYTAGTSSLAMLEMLVHLQYRELLDRYVLFEVSFEDAWVETVNVAQLPRTWRKSPPLVRLQEIGDRWAVQLRSVVLQVPSATAPAEWNYLLNPAHPDFRRIAIGPRRSLHFDPRLLKGRGWAQSGPDR